MTSRRTTLAAESDDLATLEDEARRRGISLARLLREVVAREARGLRAGRRPRYGVGASGRGAARASVEDEDAPARDRRGVTDGPAA